MISLVCGIYQSWYHGSWEENDGEGVLGKGWSFITKLCLDRSKAIWCAVT
jgi:hypothetical protein